MTLEEIERGFISTGWEVPGFTEYPLVGNWGYLSIVAHKLHVEGDDPLFELIDRRRVLGHWVREIPTPWEAAQLLEEYGGPPEEQRGNPYVRGE